VNTTNLLLTSAVAVFMAATCPAMAQENVPHRERTAPAEKMAPQNGPGVHNQGPNGRMGEAPQSRGRTETTGQAPRDERQSRPAEHNVGQERVGVEQPRKEQDRLTGQAPREDRTNSPSQQTEQNRVERERQQNPVELERRQDRVEREKQQDRVGRERQQDRVDRERHQDRVDRERHQDRVERERQQDRVERERQQNRVEQERGRIDRPEGNRETTGQAVSGARSSLSPEMRTRIHEFIVQERNAPRVNSPNFEVSIGTRVPRTVPFIALPQTVVEIEPEWRGYEYFLIGDEMVIVDPRTMAIVAIVDA
jgi:hypothetical protein